MAAPLKFASAPTEHAKAERTRLRIRARGPLGDFVAVGQTAKALRALVRAGVKGVTALETGTWAFRLAAYVHVLRHEFGLDIEMQPEEHDGGWHGRYVLRSVVTLLNG